ncbi:MAG: DUF2975 domain-containing protein [Ferruginibacter sp.]
MSISTKQILQFLTVIAWIIFIGLCIEAGGTLFNTFFPQVVHPAAAGKFWDGADMTALYRYDKGYFLVQGVIISIVAVLKAIMFYLLIKLLHNKHLTMEQPFRKETTRFIFNVSYLTLLIGLFSIYGKNYSSWLGKKGIVMPALEQMNLGGADVWLFMSVTLFVIGHIFKRGIDIQTENELTV